MSGILGSIIGGVCLVCLDRATNHNKDVIAPLGGMDRFDHDVSKMSLSWRTPTLAPMRGTRKGRVEVHPDLSIDLFPWRPGHGWRGPYASTNEKPESELDEKILNILLKYKEKYFTTGLRL